jgi:hypothetical protein
MKSKTVLCTFVGIALVVAFVVLQANADESKVLVGQGTPHSGTKKQAEEDSRQTSYENAVGENCIARSDRKGDHCEHCDDMPQCQRKVGL